jgi:hypothetical protein
MEGLNWSLAPQQQQPTLCLQVQFGLLTVVNAAFPFTLMLPHVPDQ